MTEERASASPREALRRELQATRLAYHELLVDIPEDAWNRPTANPAWTVRQMMFHMTLALRFLPADIALMRSGRVPPIPTWLFDRANEWFTRLAAKRQTRASLASEYDKRHDSIMALLETIEPQEWATAVQYPDINRNLQGTRTIADMFHYVAVHFNEHAADVRQALARGAQAAQRGRSARTAQTPRAANPPRGVARLLFRAPLLLYRVKLGWLLGGRFLHLTHFGRKSGLPRQTVLEVVDRDPATDTYYVASGFGRKSHWFKNIQSDPRVTIQVGARLLQARAEVLDPGASGQKMVEYARRYPLAAQILTRVLGYEVDGSEEQYRQLGVEHLPIVALRSQRVLRRTASLTQLAAAAFLLLVLLLPLVLGRLRKSQSTHNVP